MTVSALVAPRVNRQTGLPGWAAPAVFAALLGLGVCGVAQAGPVSSRADLQSLLGAAAMLEDFESFTAIPPLDGAALLTCDTGNTLTAASVCNGQGPGLVDPGISLSMSGPGTRFQWNDKDYVGAPSREFLMSLDIYWDGDTPLYELVVDFVTPVGAFGVDLRAFTGYSDIARVDIYAADDVTLLESVDGIALGFDGVPVFFGWQDAGGIGRIALSPSVWDWSPIIDNLEFGNLRQQAVPVPPTALLVGLGLAILRLGQRRV